MAREARLLKLKYQASKRAWEEMTGDDEERRRVDEKSWRRNEIMRRRQIEILMGARTALRISKRHLLHSNAATCTLK